MPTTEDVRFRYAEIRSWEAVTVDEQIGMEDALREDFDRWLEAHDAQVRVEAAREALTDAADEIEPSQPFDSAALWLRARAAALTPTTENEGIREQ